MKWRSTVRTFYSGSVVCSVLLSVTSCMSLKETLHSPPLARDNADILQRNGLIANRLERYVSLETRATGIKDSQPVEFLLIGPNSGHAYESVLVSISNPSEIDEALSFIGAPHGTASSPSLLRFGSKGDRIIASFSYRTGFFRKEGQVGELLLDQLSEEAADIPGWVFTGSQFIPNPDEPGSTLYAADAFDPGSIISTYSEPATVLDVPDYVPKGDVYGTYSSHPHHSLTKGTPVIITLRPERVDGNSRVTDVRLEIAEDILTFQQNGKESVEIFKEISDLKTMIEGVRKASPDVFVTLSFGNAASLNQVIERCRELESLRKAGLLRFNPPEKGGLFHQAFLPEERFRRKEERPSQPPELHLNSSSNGLAAVLRKIDKEWGAIGNEATYSSREIIVEQPADLEKALSEIDSRLRVLLVFFSGPVTYENLMSYVCPIRKSHPIIYVFNDE